MKNLRELSCLPQLFGDNVKLLPNVFDLFELELAYMEYRLLSKEDLLARTAYIQSVGDNLSSHYLICSEIPNSILENRSAFTKAYFREGQFSTGYATHGLFPYRGKFHPQLIKALLNILEVKKGETVLDPMAGSGTTNIESSLLEINSIAIDVSPFCRLMTDVKYEALTISKKALNEFKLDTKKYFNIFAKGYSIKDIQIFDNVDDRKIYRLLLLAYLDALGYSMRITKSNHEQCFEKVAARYIDTVTSFVNKSIYNKRSLGKVSILNDADALNINLKDESIDCIITSPPYSFAIDYAENDRPQLEYLGIDTDELKKNMIGLNGKKKSDKLTNYFSDMEKICFEMSRVLKKGKYCVVIIGSNTNQTGGIRLETSIIAFCKQNNMLIEKIIEKPIRGMRNTMKSEYILIFRKIK